MKDGRGGASGCRSMPSFSVLTPSLNQLDHLRCCVASVEMQGYPDVEQIVIDGGSGDNTADYLAGLGSPVAYWQSRPDRGQSHALNMALEHVEGQWVVWQNSDDAFLPGALWRVAEALRANPGAEVVVGDTLVADERCLGLGLIGVAPVSPRRWLEGFWPYNQSVYFSRDLMARVGSFDEDLRLHMDTDFLARVARLDPDVLYLDSPLGVFRKHAGAKTFDARGSAESVRERRLLEERYGRRLWPETPLQRASVRLRFHLIRLLRFGPGSLVRRLGDRASRQRCAESRIPGRGATAGR